jgi:hypothetical protein
MALALMPLQVDGVLATSPSATSLARGKIGNFRWAVEVEREPSGNPQRPCISTATDRGGVVVCGPLEPVPLLLADSSGVGKKKRTVLAMGFSRRVAAVRLWLGGSSSRLIDLNLLSSAQAIDLGLHRFAFAARAFAGKYCLHRFATYDRTGELLQISPKMGCSE